MQRFAFLFILLAAPALAQSLRIMTFNVRYPAKGDGDNVWENRRDFLVDVIRQQRPDIMGTQELFKLQGDYIVSQLPQYAWFGVSRRGNEQDEYMGVFYRKDRVRLVEQGNFWLSETPDTPGSASWNMSLPRMATWGLFDRKGKRFYLVNTHFAHRREDEAARLESVKVIAARLKKLHPDVPVILTGDFNAPAGGEVYKQMLAATGLRDTRGAGGRDTGPNGTFHGFKGTPGEARIDWILTSPGWRVKSNAALTTARGSRYPSDHFPIVTDLRR